MAMLLVAAKGERGYSLGPANRRKGDTELWSSPEGELYAPSCALRVKTYPKAGRQLVAAAEVPAGEILFAETPFLQNEVNPSQSDKKLMDELMASTKGEHGALLDEFGSPMVLADSQCGLWRVVGLLHAYGKADKKTKEVIDEMVRQLPEHSFQPAHSQGGSKTRLVKSWLPMLQKSGLFEASVFRDKGHLLRFIIFLITHPMPIEVQTGYRQYGLFEYSCLADHSCEPCVMPTPGYFKDGSSFAPAGTIAPVAGVPVVMLWKTLRALRPGDVITFAYNGSRLGAMPQDCSKQFPHHTWDPDLHRVAFSRRLELFNTYGFACGCSLCSRESGFDSGLFLQMFEGLMEELIAQRNTVFGNGMKDIPWDDWVEWYDEHPEKHPIPDQLDMMLQKSRDRELRECVCDPLDVAEKIRAVGSKFFEVERYDRAIMRYNQAKRFLPIELSSGKAVPKRPCFASKINGACDMFCRCNANIALCYLKLAKYEDCRRTCDQFLAAPGKSNVIAGLREKVLYRKAKAVFELGDPLAARETLSCLAAADDAQVVALRRAIDEKLGPEAKEEPIEVD